MATIGRHHEWLRRWWIPMGDSSADHVRTLAPTTQCSSLGPLVIIKRRYQQQSGKPSSRSASSLIIVMSLIIMQILIELLPMLLSNLQTLSPRDQQLERWPIVFADGASLQPEDSRVQVRIGVLLEESDHEQANMFIRTIKMINEGKDKTIRQLLSVSSSSYKRPSDGGGGGPPSESASKELGGGQAAAGLGNQRRPAASTHFVPSFSASASASAPASSSSLSFGPSTSALSGQQTGNRSMGIWDWMGGFGTGRKRRHSFLAGESERSQRLLLLPHNGNETLTPLLEQLQLHEVETPTGTVLLMAGAGDYASNSMGGELPPMATDELRALDISHDGDHGALGLSAARSTQANGNAVQTSERHLAPNPSQRLRRHHDSRTANSMAQDHDQPRAGANRASGNHNHQLAKFNIKLEPMIEFLDDGQSALEADCKVCQLIESGVHAILGPIDGASVQHVQSICDNLEIPYFELRPFIGGTLVAPLPLPTIVTQDYPIQRHQQAVVASSSELATNLPGDNANNWPPSGQSRGLNEARRRHGQQLLAQEFSGVKLTSKAVALGDRPLDNDVDQSGQWPPGVSRTANLGRSSQGSGISGFVAATTSTTLNAPERFRQLASRRKLDNNELAIGGGGGGGGSGGGLSGADIYPEDLASEQRDFELAAGGGTAQGGSAITESATLGPQLNSGLQSNVTEQWAHRVARLVNTGHDNGTLVQMLSGFSEIGEARTAASQAWLASQYQQINSVRPNDFATLLQQTNNNREHNYAAPASATTTTTTTTTTTSATTNNKLEDLTLNLYPPSHLLTSAYIDLIYALNWTSFAIVYEEGSSMIKLQDLFKESSGTWSSRWKIRLFRYDRDSLYLSDSPQPTDNGGKSIKEAVSNGDNRNSNNIGNYNGANYNHNNNNNNNNNDQDNPTIGVDSKDDGGKSEQHHNNGNNNINKQRRNVASQKQLHRLAEFKLDNSNVAPEALAPKGQAEAAESAHEASERFGEQISGKFSSIVGPTLNANENTDFKLENGHNHHYATNERHFNTKSGDNLNQENDNDNDEGINDYMQDSPIGKSNHYHHQQQQQHYSPTLTANNNFNRRKRHGKQEGSSFRDVFWRIKLTGEHNVLLDVKSENLFSALKQAQQVGCMTEEYSYLITSLDLHMIDLEDFKYSRTRITGLSLLQVSKSTSNSKSTLSESASNLKDAEIETGHQDDKHVDSLLATNEKWPLFDEKYLETLGVIRTAPSDIVEHQADLGASKSGQRSSVGKITTKMGADGHLQVASLSSSRKPFTSHDDESSNNHSSSNSNNNRSRSSYGSRSWTIWSTEAANNDQTKRELLQSSPASLSLLPTVDRNNEQKLFDFFLHQQEHDLSRIRVSTSSAILHDSLILFMLGLNELDPNGNFLNSPQAITCSLESQPWSHGSSMVNYMRQMSFNGLTGAISFDQRGLRNNFKLDVMGMAPNLRLVKVGEWHSSRSNGYKRYPFEQSDNSANKSPQSEYPPTSGDKSYEELSNRYQIELENYAKMLENGRKIQVPYNKRVSPNKALLVNEIIFERLYRNQADQIDTLVVTAKLSQPYFMLKETPNKLDGNDQFEGYAVDLIHELSKLVNFKYKWREVADKKYGSKEVLPNGTVVWNGMIGEIVRGVADLAIVDLTITAQRESAVDFTLPFMNTGISILFKKPTTKVTTLFSFLSPFSSDVWAYVLAAYCGISAILFLVGHLSPYEWADPHPCRHSSYGDETVLKNQFSLLNSFWFTIGSLMQQGSDLTPRSMSTRTIAGIWYFFTLIMISSYTANLAAFLTVEKVVYPIENVRDLSNQQEIKYGCVESGSTCVFFHDSQIDTYKKIDENMVKFKTYVRSNDEGQKRVGEGKFAFFMESTTIEYIIERNCNLTQIGGLIDSKGYGLATSKKSRHKRPYRTLLNEGILHLQETGMLHVLKNRWWKERRGGGTCTDDGKGGGVTELSLANVGGVFVVLLGGLGISFLVAIAEFMWRARRSGSTRDRMCEEMMNDLKFALACKSSTKPNNKTTGRGFKQKQQKQLMQQQQQQQQRQRILQQDSLMSQFNDSDLDPLTYEQMAQLNSKECDPILLHAMLTMLMQQQQQQPTQVQSQQLDAYTSNQAANRALLKMENQQQPLFAASCGIRMDQQLQQQAYQIDNSASGGSEGLMNRHNHCYKRQQQQQLGPADLLNSSSLDDIEPDPGSYGIWLRTNSNRRHELHSQKTIEITDDNLPNNHFVN